MKKTRRLVPSHSSAKVPGNSNYRTSSKTNKGDPGTPQDSVAPGINVPCHTRRTHTLTVALGAEVMTVANVETVESHENGGGVGKIGARK